MSDELIWDVGLTLAVLLVAYLAWPKRASFNTEAEVLIIVLAAIGALVWVWVW
jgi:hypothetical protein